MSHIHPTAIIDPSVKQGKDISIGPYCVIKENTVIGDYSILEHHVSIGPNTSLGERCHVHPGAVVGGDTQDLKYNGGVTYAKIGKSTTIRECVTINRGTEDGSSTIVGDNCLLMAYSHVAHNCEVGDNVILANVATLAGHVIVQDNAILGGMAGVHQFCKIGKMAIIGGCSKVVNDIVPFASADGYPAVIRTINSVGLTRNGISRKRQQIIRKAYKILFDSDITLVTAVKKVQEELASSEEVQEIINFIKQSTRGIPR